MKYAFLIYLEDAKFDAMTQAERDGYVNAQLAYDDDLRGSGHYIESAALKSPQSATSVRAWSGSVTVSDGPFAETKEHLGGLFIVEARDLNDAIQAAGRMPLAKVGTIEIRPIEELELIPAVH